MWILEWLFSGNDPATKWVADPNVKRVLDLDRPSLYGIALGDSVSQVERLGPPRNRNASKYEEYDYGDRGFTINATQQAVCGFTLFFVENDRESRCAPFSGTITHRGSRIVLSGATSERAWRELFGEPYWRDIDDKEILLFHEWGEVEWQVEFSRDGGLRVLIIETPPLLSGPDQRAAYGVDKPWPPE